MITQRVWFALIPLAMLASATSACVPKTTTAPAAYAPAASRAVADGTDEPDPALQPILDVYGNEIQDAITDYRIDTGGVMYEEHSPDTEVPHLSPPLM